MCTTLSNISDDVRIAYKISVKKPEGKTDNMDDVGRPIGTSGSLKKNGIVRSGQDLVRLGIRCSDWL